MITRLTQLTGIGPGLAEKIARHFDGEEAALEEIAKDPYRLMEVEGIGFRRADCVAQTHYGVGDDDPLRHGYGNAYLVRESGGRMHDDEFYAKRWALGLCNESYRYAGVVCEPDLPQPWVWVPEELEAERTLSGWLAETLLLMHRQAANPDPQFSLEGEISSILHPVQQQAVRAVLWPGNRVVCLTGGAGTGKTTMIAEVIRLTPPGHCRVMTFAGKAADRVRQALNERGLDGRAAVSTIHRALEYHPQFGFQAGYFTEPIIIVDEASMVPTWLLAEIVSRLNNSKLVLVGDAAQLPPIGLGFPFRDFMTIKNLPTIRLTQNYRQAEQRSLFELAEGIRTRQATAPQVRGSAIQIETALTPRQFNNWCEAIFDQKELGDLTRWQAITFKNADRERFNIALQENYNPAGRMVFEYLTRALKSDERQWCQVRVGDKIAIRQNSYELEVFNGQTGFVRGKESVLTEMGPAEFVLVEMDERTVQVPLELAPDLLELAYCITCHKAQGSGWPHVIILQPESVGLSPHRWWYTAVSRAEQSLTILTYMGFKSWWANTIKLMPEEPSSLLERFNRDHVRKLVHGDWAAHSA